MFTPAPAATSSRSPSTLSAVGPRIGRDPSGRGSTIHQLTTSGTPFATATKRSSPVSRIEIDSRPAKRCPVGTTSTRGSRHNGSTRMRGGSGSGAGAKTTSTRPRSSSSATSKKPSRRISIRAAGIACIVAEMAAVVSVPAPAATTPTRSSGASRSRATLPPQSRRRSCSSTTRLASGTRSRPYAVSSTFRGLRSNSLTPSCCSMRLIC